SNSSISGMGPMVSAQPSAIPGQVGTTGSGDISSYNIPYVIQTFRDYEEKEAKARKKDTDYSNDNIISTPDINGGYKSKKFLKKIKKSAAGLNPWLDYQDTNVTSETQPIPNAISAFT